jgi:hypothetical protein
MKQTKMIVALLGLALTPPMGWYPWNIFGHEPQNEKLNKEIVDALVASSLKDAGYSYVGPDEGIRFYRGSLYFFPAIARSTDHSPPPLIISARAMAMARM